MKFEHYLIRALCSDDLNAYHQLIETNRKRLEDFFAGTVSRTKTQDDTKVYLTEILQKAKDRSYFPFIITDTNTDQIIGFLDVKNIDWNIPKAELGCYADEQYAGKGITQKALSVFIDYLFAEYGFEKLFLRTHENNIAAQSIAEKCGFQIEGKIRKDYKTTKGELVDLIYYGKLK